MSRRGIQVLAAATSAVVALGVGVGWAPGAASGAAASSSGSGATPPRAALTGLLCHHALLPVKRSISDTAVIRPISGSRKLAVNFRLLRRPAGGGSFSPVLGPGLGTWLTKASGSSSSDAWRVIHTVSDLSAPDVYRFDVAFRWIGSDKKVLSHEVRFSRTCRQPELRPDLEVRSIAVHVNPSNSSQDIYRAEIRDAGVTGVRRFLVQLANQGVLVNKHVRIAPLQTLAVKLVGPLCNSSAPPTVTADPHHRIAVSSRAQASLTATCPASTSG